MSDVDYRQAMDYSNSALEHLKKVLEQPKSSIIERTDAYRNLKKIKLLLGGVKDFAPSEQRAEICEIIKSYRVVIQEHRSEFAQPILPKATLSAHDLAIASLERILDEPEHTD